MRIGALGMVLIGQLALCAGCQVNSVELRGTRRTVSLDDVRRTQQTANERLSRVAARLDLEEWSYVRNTDPVTQATATQPDGFTPGSTSELPLRGSRIQCTWDNGHRRLAMRTQPLESPGKPARGEDAAAQERRVIVHRTAENDELRGEFSGNNVTLERFPRTGQVHVYNDWALKQGLENDMFFSMAEHWGGRIEAVQDNGLDLVKVTWTAMGVDTIVWFRPDQGFRLHRKETRDFRSQLHSRIVASDYREVDGFPYPFSYEVTRWDDWDTRRITEIHRYTVRSVAFGGAVDDDEFKIDVPAGAIVSTTVHEPSFLAQTSSIMVSPPIPQTVRADLDTLWGMATTSSRPAETADTASR